MFDAGVESPLGELLPLIRSVVAGVEIGELDASDAARVVEECAEAERLLAALRVVAATMLEDKALWRRKGFRSVAAWMASKTGCPVGPAIAALEMAGRLNDLPLVAEAFRGGRLSEEQAREIAAAASEVPDAQEQLLEAAGKLTLQGLREECRLLTKGVDVAAVAHAGYTIPAHLRTALGVRDRTCIVPGCDARRRLEKDHRNAFGRARVTKLEDLAHLCPFHHYLKTFCGYTYRGGPANWEWIPPENRDEDLSALRRVIPSVRRC